MSRRTLGFIAILLVAVGLGAMREFIFINLNYQIDFLASQRQVSYAHSMFQGWTRGLGLRDLIMLKWIMSGLFMLFMLALAILLARLLTGGHRHLRTIVLVYVVAGLLALLFNQLSMGADAWYNLSIRLLHALQYPVILLFVWAAHHVSTARG